MLQEVNEAQQFLKNKFGKGNIVPDGTYAIPTNTSKGNAFMRVEIKNNNEMFHFDLWWDEALTISWYDNHKPATN